MDENSSEAALTQNSTENANSVVDLPKKKGNRTSKQGMANVNNKNAELNEPKKIVYRSITNPNGTKCTIKATGGTIMDKLPSNTANVANNVTPKNGARKRVPVAKPKLVGSSDLRVKQELDQLKRRYQTRGFTLKRSHNEQQMIEFRKQVEDPDFPFDLESIHLRIALPHNYPKEGNYPTFKVLNEEIPDSVKARIQNRMNDLSERTTKGEPVVKELLRLLDKNLEKWMVALPALEVSSGIKIIPGSDIVVSPKPAIKVPEPEQMGIEIDKVSRSLGVIKVGVPVKKDLALTTARYLPPEHIKIESIRTTSTAGSIQMALSDLFFDNIGIMIPIHVGISLSCSRCKHTTVVTDLRPDSDRIIACSGCRQHMEIQYTREAIHAHSNKLGYLRTKRCYPNDLLPSRFQVTCNSCTPSEPLASSIIVDGVKIGEKISFACRNCHKQCGLHYESVAWTQIPSLASTTSKAIENAKLPTKMGEPLPGYGTCSHFKKSHRWFRFPCCGRAYACDECHAADPASGSHPIEWATRQICGYCSREFPIAQKYCECGEDPAAVMKKTAHWEGGKGTRDQNVMSKKDRKKYRNQDKTVSNRARLLNK